MDTIVKVLSFLHVTAGFISLAIFWIPVISRKGGVNHIRLGKIYIKLMWIVVITAFLLCIKNFITGNTIGGSFLGFLALISANPLWYGISILRIKNGKTENFIRKQLAFKFLILISGICLIVFGITLLGSGVSILMFIFGALSFTEVPQILRLLKSKKQETNRLKDHLIAMCTSGIAAYTAFFVFGVNQIFHFQLQGYWVIVPWVTPSIIGTVGITLGIGHFMKKGIIGK